MFMDFDMSGSPDALSIHNPDATFTSRGCIRKCSFCAVPKIEGNLVELEDWKVKPIICDNNLLACSDKHFNKVIDKLLEHNINNIDFQQGLDARLLSELHAKRFSELPINTVIRLAWDNIKIEGEYKKAFDILIDSGIKPSQIRVYVLFGYKDTPEDARYRLETIRNMGALPNPSRYQALNSKNRNEYIEEGWTNDLLTKYMRYWANLKITGAFSFDEYKRSEKLLVIPENQMTFAELPK